MISAVLQSVLRHWLLCTAVAFLAAAGAYGIGLFLIPVYRVELTLAPVTDAAGRENSALAGLGGLVAAAGLAGGGAQAKNEALATLRSRTFIGDYIQDRDLIPQLFPKRFSPDGKPLPNEKRPTLNDAVTMFLDSLLLVTEDTRTGLVTVRIDFTNAETALAWARDLVSRVNEVRRDRDLKEATESIKYLSKVLEETPQVSIRDAISRVLEDQLQKSTMVNARREYAFRTLEPGMIPDRPVRPHKLRMVLAGFLVGGLLTAFAVCARDGVFTPRAQ
jgi:uncharacterized protein involved in exopolysaccharide biosynthesis